VTIIMRKGWGPGEHDELCPVMRCINCEYDRECEYGEGEHPCWCTPIRMGRSVERHEIMCDLRSYVESNPFRTLGGRHARWRP